MSMTESEALEWFKGFYNGDCEREDFEHTICADCNFPCRHGMPILRAISALEEIQQYRAIGTVYEFRELKEKATVKKVKRIYEYGMFDCPHCNRVLPIVKKYPHCTWCGGLIDYDWSEGKE